jgi:hypothetical protein
MNKGGIIKESKAFYNKTEIKVPLLSEIVIMGYKPSSGQNGPTVNNKSTEHPLLMAECMRVVKKLEGLDVPEWKDKNMQFAFAFKFNLK